MTVAVPSLSSDPVTMLLLKRVGSSPSLVSMSRVSSRIVLSTTSNSLLCR